MLQGRVESQTWKIYKLRIITGASGEPFFQIEEAQFDCSKYLLCRKISTLLSEPQKITIWKLKVENYGKGQKQQSFKK